MLTFKDLNKERQKKKAKTVLSKKGKEIFSILLIIGLVVGCGKDDNSPIIEPDPIQEEQNGNEPGGSAITLESIAPLEGPKGTILTITGNNFGTDPRAVTVLINNKEMSVITITDVEIQVEVLPSTFSGEVEIRFPDKQFFLGIFNYEITVEVTTLAGSIEGAADGFGPDAQFYEPRGISFDTLGNLYIADSRNHRIRKVTVGGEVSTYSGSTCGFKNGHLETATYCFPYAVYEDEEGGIFVSDSNNDAIRKIDRNGNVFIAMRDFQNELGETERLNNPVDYAMDSQGNIYIADSSGHRIIKKTPEGTIMAIGNGNIGDVDGKGQIVEFSFPSSLVIDENDYVYVADGKNDKIRKIAPDGTVSTYAGSGNGSEDGTIEEAKFNDPRGIAIDGRGSFYVTDYGNHKIRKISPEGRVTTLAGGERGSNDGVGMDAQFYLPYDLVVNPEGTLIYVTDTFNHRIRKIILD